MSFFNYPDHTLPVQNEVLIDFSARITDEMTGDKLTSKAINNLPDSDFAYISPGGKKDSEGKTIPRSLRHLPIPDAAHVRNALARLDQTKIPAAAKKAALAKIKKKAKDLGVQVSESDGASDKSKQEKLEKEEYRQDKKEMSSETLKERLKHHQDAVKNLEKEIKSLEKDKKEDVKDVKKESDAASDKQKAAKEKFLEMIRKKKGGDKKDSDKKPDDKKSSKKDESKGGIKQGKSDYPALDKPTSAKTKKQWDKTDKKELDRDTKKEKKEHEKDAVKDDDSKIKKLEKGKPSEKKRAEVFYLKKDKKFDKKNASRTVSTVAAEYPTSSGPESSGPAPVSVDPNDCVTYRSAPADAAPVPPPPVPPSSSGETGTSGGTGTSAVTATSGSSGTQGIVATHYPDVAFKPVPFQGEIDAPKINLLEPIDWEKLKKELSLNTLWFKKPKAPKVDYRKFLDPHFKP